jgi:hypothetical protein
LYLSPTGAFKGWEAPCFVCDDMLALSRILTRPQVLDVSEFPRRVDFSAVPLGVPQRRVVALVNPSAAEFDFEVTAVQENPALQLRPRLGKVPPRGRAEIEITFQPLVPASVQAEYELHCSQFNFSPRRIAISGSSNPWASREAALAEIQSGSEDEAAPRVSDASSLASLVDARRELAMRSRGQGSGAVRDAGLIVNEQWLEERKRAASPTSPVIKTRRESVPTSSPVL